MQKKENVSNQCSYAFGDSDNDYEMIKAIGNGVAMKNANDRLKSVAKYITKSNDDDGIALFINKELHFETF